MAEILLNFKSSIISIEFLSLVSAVSISIFLAVIVYRSNKKSATNILFCLLSLCTLLWLVYSYIVNLPPFLNNSTFLARLGIFFAAPMSSLFFLLGHTLPSDKILLSRKSFLFVIVATIVMMALNISPYAFKGATIVNGAVQPTPGIGFIPFAVLSTIFSILAVYFLMRKARSSQGEEKEQMLFVLIGLLLMLVLVIATVLVPILFFGSGLFVAFIPLYTTVFLGMTSYAIVRHHLFDLKVIATETFTFLLWIMLFARLFSSSTPGDWALNFIIVVASVIFGTLLIKSVRQEVRQRVELEKLSRFKTQLLSLASHQIRSPLAAMKGFLSLLADGSYGPVADKQKEVLAKIKAQADELIDLINGLLDFRKMDEGKMEYRFEPTDIMKLAQDVVEALRPLAMAKKLELTAAVQGGNVVVNADVQKLRQVIVNLVDNAIKYTLNGFVKLEAKTLKDKVIISITDSGLGMDSSLLPHVFQEFVRGEGVKQTIRGTGLGLYIAKGIVEAHGGRIWAESPGDGKGSTFFIEIKRS